MIRHNEKVANHETGYGPIASRLMGLLESPRIPGSGPYWNRNNEYAQNPIDDEEFVRQLAEEQRRRSSACSS